MPSSPATSLRAAISRQLPGARWRDPGARFAAARCESSSLAGVSPHIMPHITSAPATRRWRHSDPQASILARCPVAGAAGLPPQAPTHTCFPKAGVPRKGPPRGQAHHHKQKWLLVASGASTARRRRGRRGRRRRTTTSRKGREGGEGGGRRWGRKWEREDGNEEFTTVPPGTMKRGCMPSAVRQGFGNLLKAPPVYSHPVKCTTLCPGLFGCFGTPWRSPGRPRCPR